MSQAPGLVIDLSRPDWEDAPDTLAALMAGHESGDILLDGSACKALPTVLVQVLLSARKTFEPRGIAVRLGSPTPALVAGLEALGLGSALPVVEGASA